jgi:hypothetical protein
MGVAMAWRCSFLALLVLLTLPVPAQAEFFRYTDEQGQSYYVQGLESVPARYRASAVPLGLRNAPPSTSAGTTIRYTPGQPIMVDVRINGSAPARLLLDTGADRTLISPRALAAAGVSLTRPFAQGQIVGVTGTDRVSFVLIDSLEVGDARVNRLPVAAYETAQLPGDGLLGRDFLGRFTVNIDSDRGVVTISPK